MDLEDFSVRLFDQLVCGLTTIEDQLWSGHHRLTEGWFGDSNDFGNHDFVKVNHDFENLGTFW